MARRRDGDGELSALGYIEQSRRRGLGALGPRRAWPYGRRVPHLHVRRWIGWILIGVALPVAGTGLLVFGSIEIGPAYAAAQGHGTLGTYTTTRIASCEHPAECSWYGDFVSADGRHTRLNVRFDGVWTRGTPGTTTPALDSGDPFTVFPRTGTNLWMRDLMALIGGTVIMVPWLGCVLLWLTRKLRMPWPTIWRRLFNG